MKLSTAALGIVFVYAAFFAAPAGLMELNAELGWPRLESTTARVVGAGLVLGGLAVVLHCSGLFRRLGLGTPVPIQPPTRLVESGIYRRSRNPIYVADVFILLGVFLCFGQLTLLLYALTAALVLDAWTRFIEEPQLRRRFGVEYESYLGRVPRWL